MPGSRASGSVRYYYLPQGDSVYVLREGRIEVLDLDNGRLSVLTDSVASNLEVLLPGPREKCAVFEDGAT